MRREVGRPQQVRASPSPLYPPYHVSTCQPAPDRTQAHHRPRPRLAAVDSGCPQQSYQVCCMPCQLGSDALRATARTRYAVVRLAPLTTALPPISRAATLPTCCPGRRSSGRSRIVRRNHPSTVPPAPRRYLDRGLGARPFDRSCSGPDKTAADPPGQQSPRGEAPAAMHEEPFLIHMATFAPSRGDWLSSVRTGPCQARRLSSAGTEKQVAKLARPRLPSRC